jgi:phosphatidylglycerophosphatase A
VNRTARMVASFAGVGFARTASGTWGSLAALPPGLLLLAVSPWLLLAGVVVVVLAGLWAIDTAEAGGDPGWVVIDEVAGQWLALLALPAPTPTLLFALWVLTAFALFRLFDIAKPGPVGWADRRHGATGVMLDDLLAGMLAGACLLAAGWLWPRLLA